MIAGPLLNSDILAGIEPRFPLTLENMGKYVQAVGVKEFRYCGHMKVQATVVDDLEICRLKDARLNSGIHDVKVPDAFQRGDARGVDSDFAV